VNQIQQASFVSQSWML